MGCATGAWPRRPRAAAQADKRSDSDGAAIQRALPDSLRARVAGHQFGGVLGRNQALFRGCAPQFEGALLGRLREVYVMPGEAVLRAGDMARELAFLAKARPPARLVHCLCTDTGWARCRRETAMCWLGVPQHGAPQWSGLGHQEQPQRASRARVLRAAGCGHAGTRVAVATSGAWRLDQPACRRAAVRMQALQQARRWLAVRARRRAQGVLEETRDDAVIRTMRADSELPNVVGEMAFFLGIPQPRSWQVRS
jgi:hypothetical protein